MDKPLQFSYTEKGMTTVPGKKGDFVSVNELLGVINELINEKTRILEKYTDTDDKSPEWKKTQKKCMKSK